MQKDLKWCVGAFAAFKYESEIFPEVIAEVEKVRALFKAKQRLFS